MNFITPAVTLTPNGSNTQPYEQIGMNQTNQVALLLPLLVRPSDTSQVSDWNIFPNDIKVKNEAPADVALNRQLHEENEKLREELDHLKQKLAFYEEILPKLIPKVDFRDVIIEKLEALIEIWKNVEFTPGYDESIERVESNSEPVVNYVPSPYIPSNKENNLVELIPSSDICIPRQFLIQTREMANESPTYYMRRILAYYFDQETFSKSSARGKGATRPLDSKITKAVWEHTLNHFPNCTMTTLVEDTNRRCAEARRTLNRKSEGKKHSSKLVEFEHEFFPNLPYSTISETEEKKD